LKPIEFTISDSQLHAVLSEIDAELRASGTKLFGRELRGWQMFCRRFKLQMAMHDPLAVRIFDWFTKQYGDRLRGNLDFGSTVAEIRHDLYSLRFPRLYGEQIVHCDPLLPSTYFGQRLSKKGQLRGNLLDHLAGGTPDFVSSLTVEECNNLIDVYARGFVGLSRMHDAEKAPFAKEALDDLHQSAAQLTAYSPNYGFSRWASLQATEKLLKSFITVCGQTPRKSHNLADLASTATSLGLPSPSSSLLRDIQCDAAVRYSAASVGKAEALRAHYATLSLCSDIAPRLRPQSGWGTEMRMLSYELNGTSRPMKALLVRRGKTVVGGP
jgi:hypothetical protein